MIPHTDPNCENLKIQKIRCTQCQFGYRADLNNTTDKLSCIECQGDGSFDAGCLYCSNDLQQCVMCRSGY